MNNSRVSLLLFTTLMFGITSACSEADDPTANPSTADAETGGLADSDSPSEDSAADGQSGSDGGGSGMDSSVSGGDESGGEELPASRITALWTESEGTYVRALPGEALAMQLPQVAEVAAFFPSPDQSLEDASAFISLLDDAGDPLMATRLRGLEIHPDGFAVDAGAELAYFSGWGIDFPIGYCVTEPCFMYPWDEAPKAAQFGLDAQRWVDGEVAGQRFYARYAVDGETHTIVEEKGFEYLSADDLSDLKRAQAAARDLAELGVEVSEHPQATADFDPCEFLENAAQGAAAAGGAACCAETGGLGCFFCFAATQSLVEWLEDLC
jgi:hypothetical protein